MAGHQHCQCASFCSFERTRLSVALLHASAGTDRRFSNLKLPALNSPVPVVAGT